RDGVVVRPADAGQRLVEDDRLRRQLHAGFGGVVGVVQADGDEVRRPRHARSDPRIAFHQRQLVYVGLLDLGETGRRQRLAVDVFDDLGQVADLAVLVDDPGLLFAGRAE